MANRTFKVYGQAYAASGDVSVVMTVGGTEVFNGAVNDSTTVRDGQPTTENHLWTYELDENIVGDLAVSITATGGELCVGLTKHNGLIASKITSDWISTNAPDSQNLSTAAQTHIATTLGESALGSDLYNALIAGTKTALSDAENATIHGANWTAIDLDTEVYADDNRINAQVNGEALTAWDDPTVNSRNWVILEDGDVLTYTWKFDPYPYPRDYPY